MLSLLFQLEFKRQAQLLVLLYQNETVRVLEYQSVKIGKLTTTLVNLLNCIHTFHMAPVKFMSRLVDL